MSTPKHTPGPWQVNLTRVDHAIVRWHIASEKHGSAFPICEHVIESEPTGAEQLANARLIAAAPDLLARLIECEEQLRGVTGALPGSDSAEVCDAARAAIERATAK
jgi:hypothetical protein